MRAFEFQESYLRAVLGFIGLTDVRVVRLEGVALDPDALREGRRRATAQAEEALRWMEGESAARAGA
jgi:FMN-dependent NADH-azoreductase